MLHTSRQSRRQQPTALSSDPRRWVGPLVAVVIMAACSDTGMGPPETTPYSAMANFEGGLNEEDCELWGGEWVGGAVGCVIDVDGIGSGVDPEDPFDPWCSRGWTWNGYSCEPDYGEPGSGELRAR